MSDTTDDKDLTIMEVVAKLRALRIQWTTPDPYADWLADRKEENRDSDGEEVWTMTIFPTPAKWPEDLQVRQWPAQ